jgi:hypothetical protein
MCYEESFFRMWGKRAARRDEKVENVVERSSPRQADQPPPVPTTANAPKRKEVEREPEVV